MYIEFLDTMAENKMLYIRHDKKQKIHLNLNVK